MGAIVSSMIRLTILLFTIGTCVYGQDSTFVKETCKKIQELTDKSDVMGQISIVSDQSIKYLSPVLNDIPKEKRVKATYTFQYRLNPRLKKNLSKLRISESSNRTMKRSNITSKRKCIKE